MPVRPQLFTPSLTNAERQALRVAEKKAKRAAADAAKNAAETTGGGRK